MGFIIRVLINAFAFWIVTLITALQVTVVAFPPGETLQQVLSFLAVAAVFALINTVIGKIVRIIAIPLYVLTLGIIGFVINGFLLWLTAQITAWWGWGLNTGDFWHTILAALVISIINALAALIIRPQRG